MGAGYGYDYDYGTSKRRAKEKELRKGIFSKILIALIILANLAFVVAILIIFCFTYSEPSTLIMAWFGFSTGELWALAFVKKQKLKKGETENAVESESCNEDLIYSEPERESETNPAAE